MWFVSEVNSGYAAMLVALAEEVLVVEKGKLFNYIVHYQIGVNSWFAANNLFVSFTELGNLGDVKSLVRVEFEHSNDDSTEFRAVLLA